VIPILSQMNPVHTFPPYFSKVHSNIILPFIPVSSSPSDFLTKVLYTIFHLFHVCYIVESTNNEATHAVLKENV
jgi:hypothetical protein